MLFNMTICMQFSLCFSVAVLAC